MVTYHIIERAVDAGGEVSDRIRSGDAPLKEIGKLSGARGVRCRRQLPFGSVIDNLIAGPAAGWGRAGLSRLRGTACDVGSRICMPARKAFHTSQHSLDVHKLLTGAWNGCLQVIALRLLCNVV